MKKICFVFLLFPMLAQGQVDTVFVERTAISRGLDGVLYTFSAPARWKGKDFAKVGGVVATVAAFTLLDEPIRNFVRSHESDFLNKVERVGYHYGKPYSAVAVTGGFYLTGLLFKNEWAKETGLMMGTALTTSNILSSLFKTSMGRARPVTSSDNYEVEPFSKSASHHSFPSGHTTVAFTMSLVLARRVQCVPLKIAFYSLAGITAASRIYMDAHWFSDVALGGTIAWFCTDVAVKRLSENHFRPILRKSNLMVKFYPYPGGLSLRATW